MILFDLIEVFGNLLESNNIKVDEIIDISSEGNKIVVITENKDSIITHEIICTVVSSKSKMEMFSV